MSKKIVAVNAGPRKGWNTDMLINEAIKGAKSAGAEVEKFDLFRLERYTGCISCFGCKKEKFKGHCICRDGLTPVLDAIRESDSMIIGSPNYLGDMTASFRALYERLIFQNLTYNAGTPCCNQRRISVLLIMTSNAPDTAYIPQLEKKGKLVISNETVRAGDKVKVMIYLEENPGITALSVDVEFSEHFALKNVEYTDLLLNRPSNSPLSNNPFTISWSSSSTTDIDNTGLFAILTFEVDLNTPVDKYPIYVYYNANNVFDSELVNVPLVINDGTVNVLKPTPGDVNRDGNINMKDLVLIQQFINHWDVNVVESAADVNDDGEINMKDLVLLQRYINGWEVVLK